MLHRRKNFTLFLVTLSILLSSCTLKYTPRTGEEFSREIVRLEKVARENQDRAVRAEAHLQLARLYIDYQNPHRDYRKAGEEFETYLSLAPEEEKEDEIQNWVLVLRKLEKSDKEVAALRAKVLTLTQEKSGKEKILGLEERKYQELQGRLEKLQGRIESLERANRSLNEANQSLKETNEKMKEMIEKLKKLDLQMEEKRKTIR
jgi:tetratricopeptide (TPR) repeat protein